MDLNRLSDLLLEVDMPDQPDNTRRISGPSGHMQQGVSPSEQPAWADVGQRVRLRKPYNGFLTGIDYTWGTVVELVSPNWAGIPILALKLQDDEGNAYHHPGVDFPMSEVTPMDGTPEDMQDADAWLARWNKSYQDMMDTFG